jgi:hypothetical protein
MMHWSAGVQERPEIPKLHHRQIVFRPDLVRQRAFLHRRQAPDHSINIAGLKGFLPVAEFGIRQAAGQAQGIIFCIQENNCSEIITFCQGEGGGFAVRQHILTEQQPFGDAS